MSRQMFAALCLAMLCGLADDASAGQFFSSSDATPNPDGVYVMKSGPAVAYQDATVVDLHLSGRFLLDLILPGVLARERHRIHPGGSLALHQDPADSAPVDP